MSAPLMFFAMLALGGADREDVSVLQTKCGGMSEPREEEALEQILGSLASLTSQNKQNW